MRRIFELTWFPLLLWLVASIAYYAVFFSRAHVELNIEVSERTWFKIYWAAENQPFSEKRMARVRVQPDQTDYTFFATDLSKVAKLRVDTHQYVGKAVLHKLILSQKAVQPIEFVTNQDFNQLAPLDQIEEYKVTEKGLEVLSTGIDPNFLFTMSVEPRPYSGWEEAVRIVAIGLFVGFFYWGLSPLVTGFRFIPLCIAVVLGLVMTMSLISGDNSHPDEFVHMPAAEYYSNHWLPPVIENPDIRHTFSPYGASRLHTDEIYYLLCGKFAKLLEPLKLERYVQYRMFNVFLLALILIWVLQYESSRLLALPFLVTPQVWYLFSYCNSDAFALTLAFFLGCQVVLGNSMFNRSLRSFSIFEWLVTAIPVGTLFGLLFLVKQNYLAYGLILAVVVVVRWLRIADWNIRKQWAVKLTVIAFSALAVFGGKKAIDYKVNGLDRSERIAAMEREMAIPIYNENTPLEKKHVFLNLKDRGIPLSKLILVDRWFEKTFRSGVGVYSYFTISAPRIFYDCMRWSLVVLMLFLYGAIFLHGDRWDSMTAVIVLVISAVLVGASLEHSWTDDFQTQGRYLFPILSMMALLFGNNREILDKRFLSLQVAFIFSISFYSFSGVALSAIPRLLNH
ncbi:hypothetical protein [Desulfopila sp. IMCC35008]|uniref:hypothetical protein n=1 Tax=Desulfopila sp. IMCC35008 TaxID=2653858 RepID=UPI0013D5467F|nr:hypothetical protein [Desulfopila sp. IMCC35008]